MKTQLGVLFGISALMVGPALTQNQPNANQAAAKALLQAADKAIGASSVKSLSRPLPPAGWATLASSLPAETCRAPI